MSALYDKFNLPHVGDRIDKTLGRLHLVPDIHPKEFIREHNGKKHRYTSICTTPDKSQVIFYARLHKNEDAYTKFRREIQFLRRLKKGSIKLKQFVPTLFTSSLDIHGEWFTREYLEAPALGTIHLAKTPLSPKDAPRFVELFQALQHIPHIQHNLLERRGGDFYLNASEGCLKNAKQYFSSNDIRRVRHFLHESFMLLDASANHMVHGDCHPGNILFDRTYMFVIDWELMHLNNRVNDIGYFYAGLAKSPQFRKAFLRRFAESISWKAEFRRLLPINTLFFALNHLCTLEHRRPKELTTAEYRSVLRYVREVVKRSFTSYTALERL